MKNNYLNTLLLSITLMTSQVIFAVDKKPKHHQLIEASILSNQGYGDEIIGDLVFSFFELLLEGVLEDIFIISDLEMELDAEVDGSISLQVPYLTNEDGRFSRRQDGIDHFTMDLSGALFHQDSHYNGANAQARFFITPYFSIDGKYSFVKSKLNDISRTQYTFYHVNLLYHRFRFTDIDLWFGPGYSEFLGASEKLSGANFQLGTEIYIFKPISISTDWNFGYVNEIGMTQGNILAKAYFDRLHIEAGYQYYRIGETVVEGPKLGLGYHFF